MKRVLALAMILASGTSGVHASESGILKGAALKKTVTGKTIYLRSQGIELPIAYRANGTMSGQLKAFAASLAGGISTKDSGRWWIANDQLCQRWNKWMGRKSTCYKLQRKGSLVRWTSNDGRSGTARISS